MQKIWCLFVLIVSCALFVTSGDRNPCDALLTTETNLTDVEVVFARLEDPHGFYHEFRGVIERFFRCYGASGGLKVSSLNFRQVTKRFNNTNGTSNGTSIGTWNGTSNGTINACKLIIPKRFRKVIRNQVRLIMSFDLVRKCGRLNVTAKLLTRLSLNPNTTRYAVNSLYNISHMNVVYNGTNSTEIIFFDTFVDWQLYEKLEKTVDSLPDPNWNMSTSEDVDWKYTYFASIPRSRRPIWPSIIAVFVVIFFFFLGLVACCGNCYVLALVDEDFLRRNEERDWLAAQLRRRPHEDATEPPEQILQGLFPQQVIRRTPSNTSIRTDSTQLSETISGTPSLSDTQIESQLPSVKAQ